MMCVFVVREDRVLALMNTQYVCGRGIFIACTN